MVIILSSTTEFASESDHKIVKKTLAKDVDHGPGEWISNNTLLKDDVFVTEIKDIIESFAQNKNDFHSKKILWEFLKQNTASSSKSFSIKNIGMRKK